MLWGQNFVPVTAVFHENGTYTLGKHVSPSVCCAFIQPNILTNFTINFEFFFCLQEQHKVLMLEGCELTDCNIDKKQFAFRIKPRGMKRVYFFCADTEQDQQEWMQALCFAKATGQMGDGSQACTVQ